MSKGKKILIGVVIFIVLVIILAMAATKGIADVASSQLTSLRMGDYVKAYSYTSKEFQQTTSLDAFKTFVEEHPAFKNGVDISFSSREINNNQGKLEGTIKTADGGAVPVTYNLVKENGEWRILSLSTKNAGPAGIQTGETPSGQTQETPTIHDVLINNTANQDGYVQETRSIMDKNLSKIYVTVQLSNAKPNMQVTASLQAPQNGTVMGPITQDVTISGNAMKAFSFTNTAMPWPSGEYKLKVNLSTGDSKEMTVNVQ